MGEARITLRSLLHFASQQIIGLPRQFNRRLCIRFRLHAGRGDRQDGEINACLVHRLQPQLIEVREAALNVGEQRVAPGRPGDIFLVKFRRRKVLLERDLAGDACSLHFGAQRLGHRHSDASLDKVAPA
jgi:hypothetical protein